MLREPHLTEPHTSLGGHIIIPTLQGRKPGQRSDVRYQLPPAKEVGNPEFRICLILKPVPKAIMFTPSVGTAEWLPGTEYQFSASCLYIFQLCVALFKKNCSYDVGFIPHWDENQPLSFLVQTCT